jgi:hypothetical protein
VTAYDFSMLAVMWSANGAMAAMLFNASFHGRTQTMVIPGHLRHGLLGILQMSFWFTLLNWYCSFSPELK